MPRVVLLLIVAFQSLLDNNSPLLFCTTASAYAKPQEIPDDFPPIELEPGLFVSHYNNNPELDWHGQLQVNALRRRRDATVLPQYERAICDRYAITYPAAVSDEIVRIGDKVYRLDQGDIPRNLKPLDEYTKLIVPNTYALPLGGVGQLHRPKDYFQYDRAIDIAPDLSLRMAKKPAADGTLEITCGYNKDPAQRVQKVKEGDLLIIGNFAHRVRRIVLSDPKLKLHGWVEIDQEPVKDEKEKGR